MRVQYILGDETQSMPNRMKFDSILFILTTLRMFIFPSAMATDNSEAISFFKDAVSHQNRPTRVTAFLCWDKGSLRSLSRALPVPLNVLEECGSTGPPIHALLLLDMDCRFAKECLKEIEQANLFRSPLRWIIIKRSAALGSMSVPRYEPEVNVTHCGYDPADAIKPNNSKAEVGKANWIQPALIDASILIDSDVVLADKNENGFKLIRVYKRRPKCPLISEYLGCWTRDAGLAGIRLDGVSSIKRMNLMGTELTASVVITDNDTLNHLTDYRDQHIDAISKVNYPLTVHLMDTLNSTRSFVWTDTWGYKSPSGGWTGMMGWLERKEADIGGTPLFITPERMEVIEYISLTTPSVSAFLFRQPPLSYVTNIFTLPFRWTVWVAACFLVLAGVVTLFAIATWEDRSHPEEENSGTVRRLKGHWGDVFLMAVGAVAQQGSTTEPISASGRLATVLLFVALMFLYTSYSANIVALLQSQTHSIRTLDDLLRSRLQLAADDTVYSRYYFPRSTDPVRRAIWEQKLSNKGSQPRFLPLDEGIRRMRKGLFAFNVELGVGYKIVSDTFKEDEKCGLSEIVFLQATDPYYAVPRNSPFKEMFRIGMRRIQEVGLQLREIHRLYTKKPPCTGKGSSFVSVGLVEVLPALEWLLGCFCLALGIFMLELLYYRNLGRPKQPEKQ